MPGIEKKVVLIALIAAAFILAIFYLQQKANAYKKVLSDNEALLVLENGQGKERWFKGEVINGMTVSDALAASNNGELLELGLRCYLNSREVKEDLAEKTISPQDKIVCKYK